jgi:hypothetical protein
MDATRLILAWALVWLFGLAIVRRVYSGTDARTPHPAWIAGAGFLAGAFVLTLIMRAVSLAGGPLALRTVGVAMVLLTAVLWLPDLRRLRAWRAVLQCVVAARSSPWTPARIAWYALLAWLAVRFALLLGEVLRQPLFPWDAWTQWATKARVWFELHRMVPFTSAISWLAGAGNAYYDAAPHYPGTVPLWQVWSSLALARWDDAWMNLPWWLIAVALALALYGFFRDQRLAPLFALAGTWLIVSLPILDTHVALAGYADLPLACYLTIGALAGFTWIGRRAWPDASIALLFLCAVPMIKVPGWIWLATLVPGLIVALLPRHGLRIVVIGWIAAVALVFLLGRYEPVLFGYRMHFQLNVPWHGLVEAYLSFANWHLLFWILPALLLATRDRVVSRELIPLTVVVGSGALFLLLGFSLTSAAIWVEDQSTVNRATLHLAPLLGAWMVLLVHRALTARAPEAAPAATTAETAVTPPLPSVPAVDA